MSRKRHRVKRLSEERFTPERSLELVGPPGDEAVALDPYQAYEQRPGPLATRRITFFVEYLITLLKTRIL